MSLSQIKVNNQVVTSVDERATQNSENLITSDAVADEKEYFMNHLVFNANVYLYGKDDYQHTVSLQEAINAAYAAGLNNVVRIICYYSDDNANIAIFRVQSIYT